MKNLKKIAALVIVLAMALSTVSFAAFTDVAEDASYNEAVTVMAALDLLKGYEDGSFGPDKTITRAEFAAVVVRMLGMEDAAAGAAAATNFTDVPATHWAAGYVKIANQKGIIAGYGDGKFGPDDEVTYEQAIKMLVCALGYAPMFADVADAYPTAYMAQANTLGMTIGAVGKIGDKATRAIVARLAYNALDDKLMQQTGFGTDKKFEAVNKTILSEYLKVVKGEATIAPVSFKLEDADKVNVSNLKYNNAANEEYYGITIANGKQDAVKGISYVKGFNNLVFIDYSEGEDEAVVKAVVPQVAKAEVLELKRDQLLESDYNTQKNTLKYYVVSQEASNATETIDIDSNAVIYKNEDVSSSNNIAGFFAGFKTTVDGQGNPVAPANPYPSVKFIDADGDGDFETITYVDVDSKYVDKINARNLAIGRYSFDPENEKQTFTLANAEGKAIAFADIKVGDVLNVIESSDGTNKKYEYIISSNVVEGTVTEIDGQDAYIGGTAYVNKYGVAQGISGKFYIDILGRIIYNELDTSSNKFATIMHMYNDTNGADTTVKAILYTAEGKFETYSFAKNVTISTAKDQNNKAIEKSYVSADFEVTTTSGVDSLEDKNDVNNTKILPANKPVVAMFATNSSNQINKIYTGAAIAGAAGSVFNYTYASQAEYDVDDNAIGRKDIADNAVIITSKYSYSNGDFGSDALEPKEENFTVAASSYFADEEKYDILYVEDTNTDKIVYMIVVGAKGKVAPTNPIMYVSTAPYGGQTADGDPYTIIKGFVDGKLTTIKVNENSTIYAEKADGTQNYNYNYSNTGIDVGALVQFNEGDVASAVRVIATGATLKTAQNGVVYNPNNDVDDDKLGYIYKGVVDKFTSKINFVGGAQVKDNDAILGITTDSNFAKIYGGFGTYDIETNEEPSGLDKDSDGFAENDDVAIAYVIDGELAAFIIIDADADNE